MGGCDRLLSRKSLLGVGKRTPVAIVLARNPLRSAQRARFGAPRALCYVGGLPIPAPQLAPLCCARSPSPAKWSCATPTAPSARSNRLRARRTHTAPVVYQRRRSAVRSAMLRSTLSRHAPLHCALRYASTLTAARRAEGGGCVVFVRSFGRFGYASCFSFCFWFCCRGAFAAVCSLCFCSWGVCSLGRPSAVVLAGSGAVVRSGCGLRLFWLLFALWLGLGCVLLLSSGCGCAGGGVALLWLSVSVGCGSAFWLGALWGGGVSGSGGWLGVRAAARLAFGLVFLAGLRPRFFFGDRTHRSERRIWIGLDVGNVINDLLAEARVGQLVKNDFDTERRKANSVSQAVAVGNDRGELVGVRPY